MKNLFNLSILFSLFLGSTHAQELGFSFKDQGISKYAKLKTMHLKQENDWQAYIQHLEAPTPGGNSYREHLMKLKADYPNRKLDLPHHKTSTSRTAEQPTLLRNFEGNIGGGGVPNDNNMAISNEGKLISVINSTMWVFDVENDTLLQTIGLGGIMAPLGLNLQSKYDPKVLFDPEAEKFILVCLNGTLSNNSRICVAFSETSDPQGNWNFYALPGNPIIDTTWSDYPQIAVSEDEFFITINSLRNNLSWQEAFVETLIWQIDKNDGYNGDSLVTRIWNEIGWNNKPVRNICPVRGSNKLYGPSLYFLSNRNFDLQNDTVFLFEITGTLGNPSTTLNANLVKTEIPYGLAPSARQENGHEFDTNDSRVLSAFYDHGEINYVQNTIGPDSGFCSVYHGIIYGLFNTNGHVGHIITDPVRDFGYPNLSYTGKFDGDNECIISFNHTAPTVWSGCSAVFYSNDEYSDPVEIKAGDNYADILNGTYERWGDYSGSQPKYDEPGVVWVNVSFGRANQRNGTWIAELASPDTSSQPPVAVESVTNQETKSTVFPNPANQYFELKFELEQNTAIEINLYDQLGKLVANLLSENAKAGRNQFRFSTQPLSTGVYSIVGKGRGHQIFQKKLVKQ